MIMALLASLLNFQLAQSQENKRFPFDPYIILKSWNYDQLVKVMGEGKEIIGKSNNQSYIAGMQYPYELLGMKGNLTFNFTKDSIALCQFRQEHAIRVTSSILAKAKILPKNRDVAVVKLDSVQKSDSIRQAFTKDSIQLAQKHDSISRDSVVQAISEIMGEPISKGATAVTQRNARYSAIWIKNGYSCMYKDYINYSEIVFSLSTVPLWAVGDFGVQPGTEIVHKITVSTMKMRWTLSLLGTPSTDSKWRYSNIFLLAEFSTGQRFLTNVPEHDINYLPKLQLDDYDGDAIPDAWIQVPSDSLSTHSNQYIYTLKLKEPNLIFNSDELVPASIVMQNGSLVKVTFADGTAKDVNHNGLNTKDSKPTTLKVAGLSYLHETERNADGSVNFIGGMIVRATSPEPNPGVIEILYKKRTTGGWEVDPGMIIKKK